MKIKNIQLTLLVFLGLVIFSFAAFVTAQQNSNSSGSIFLDSDQDGLTDQEEALYGTDSHNPDTDGDGYSDGTEVKSGYDPKKPAPGDRLATANAPSNNQASGAVLGNESENLTAKVSQKVTELVQNAQNNEEGSENSGITLEQLQEIVNQSFITSGTGSIEDGMPEIKKEDIKILKQNYSKLSEKEQKEKKKEDFLNYTVATAYIFSSNSPQPITSSQDMTKVVTSVYQTITQAMESRNVSSLDDLEKSGDKILEQLKDLEVPEEMVDTHIKAMRYATYAKDLKKTLAPNSDDPLSDIANFSKMQAFIESLQDFTVGIQSKFSEYDISLSDEALQSKLKSFGLDGIKIDDTSDSNSDSASDSNDSSSSD